MSRLPHFLDNWLNDGTEVVSLTCPLSFTPQEDILALISIRGRVNIRAILQLD
jgi:hypothetical protein